MAKEDLRKDGDWRRRAAERSYVFGGFRLMPDRQVLLHAGEPVRVGSRALDILALLVQRAGEVVTRSEIEAYVWPRVTVHESNLKVHVAALRKALRAASGEAPGLLNLPGRGYRFTRPVTVEGRAGVSAQRTVAARAGAFAPPAGIIGRDDEIARLADLIASRPLTTVVGPGGVGKTTVALAAADRLSTRFGPPVFVDFTAIDDPQLVAHAIAAALRLRVDLSDLLGGIGEHLRASARLLILDNCEHLSASVAAAADYLATDPGPSALLATSRGPLSVRNEQVFRLAPLACPEAGAAEMSAAVALRSPAVALFAARAAEHAGYVLADDDTAAVSAICRRLDGLPLAIGLAATRLDHRRPSELLALLQDTLAPDGRAADVTALGRHRTLLATLDWSYGLLSTAEACLLRHAAIFPREFRLEDAIAVLGPALDPAEIVAGLESLVSKSFALADVTDGARSYRLFESARSHALARLEAAREAEFARLRHARHIAALLERAEAECDWRAAQDWAAQYAPRLDDLRRAIAWAFGPTGDSLVAIRLTAAAIPLWGMLSSVDESRPRVAAAFVLANALPDCDPRLRMKLAHSRAWTLTYAGAAPTGEDPPWREALRLAREVGDTEYELRALHGLATHETFTGACSAAIDHLVEYAAIAARAQAWAALPDALRLLALARVYTGDLREGSRMLETLAARFGRVEVRAQATRFAVDRYCIIRSSLAFTRWLRGDVESALCAAGQAVAGALALDHSMSHSNSLAFADVPLALWTGDLGRAAAGVDALRKNQALRNTGIWPRFTGFFAAALRHAQGDDGAIADMAENLDGLLATGFVTRAPMYLAMLAEALLSEGRIAEARARIADAAARVARSGECWCRPEILRIEALLLAATGDRAAAQARLQDAIADAQAQGVRIFEHRAADALGALNHD